MTDKVHGNSKVTEVYKDGKLVATVSSAVEAASIAGISSAYVCILKRNGGETVSGYSFREV